MQKLAEYSNNISIKLDIEINNGRNLYKIKIRYSEETNTLTYKYNDI